jgi:coronin-1B/1C/6
MKDSKASMATMASKFADKDESEDDDDDETSSFEEIPKPIERPAVVAARATPAVTKEPELPKPDVSAELPKASPTSTFSAPKAVPPQETPAPAAAAASAPTPTGAAAGIKDYLTDIKSMLEQQNRTMTSQMEQIVHLTQEVNTLKAKVGDQGGSRAKDERIRQLELELEEARS